MEGIISNFRGGRHTKSNNQMILVVKGIISKDKTTSLMKKTVTWTSPAGKKIKGEITHPHGNKGAVRVAFEKGMPGQAIGQTVNVE